MTGSRRPRLRRVFGDIRPHARPARRGAAAVAVGTACATAGPLIVGVAIDRGVVGGDLGWLAATSGAYAVVALGQAVAVRLELRWLGRFAQDYLRALRDDLTGQLFRLDLDFFARERSGRLVSRLTSDVDNLQQFLENGLGLLLRAGLLVVMTLTAMLWTSLQLGLLVVMLLVPLAVLNAWYRRRAYVAQVDVRDRIANVLTQLNESLVGARVVQAYTVEADQRRTFGEVNQAALDSRLTTARINATFYPLVELMHPVVLAVILGYGAVLVGRGALEVGAVVAFTLYVARLFEPIQQLTELSHLLQASAASFAKIFAFRDERPRVGDAPGAGDLTPGPGAVDLEGVSFRYDAHGPDVLVDIDLRVVPGQRVALVGASGAGKTTLAKVLTRLYDPTSGRVLVDGQDVRTVTGSSLRWHVAIVPQEGFLFDGTVADNIALARPGATRSDVEAACAALGVAERLAALPQGLDTRVTNRGLSLSAGQRQLVALARAFVAEPRVLVLDEATSNLDPATEATVEGALRTLFRGRTAIVIAHRIASALRADRVVMMANGRIVEDGPPRELLAQRSHFARWVAGSSSMRTTPS